MKVLTEADLRSHKFRPGEKEYRIPGGTFVTPTAKEYLRQIKNLEIINTAAKECLENLGKEHDNIKTREIKETLEEEMNHLARTIMDNDEEYKRLKEEIRVWGEKEDDEKDQ